jgi:hypothetical protein
MHPQAPVRSPEPGSTYLEDPEGVVQPAPGDLLEESVGTARQTADERFPQATLPRGNPDNVPYDRENEDVRLRTCAE